jgi:hypothetical protein
MESKEQELELPPELHHTLVQFQNQLALKAQEKLLMEFVYFLS